MCLEFGTICVVYGYSKTRTVGPYNVGILIVTFSDTVSLAQICVPFAEIQKLVQLKPSSNDLCAVCTQQGLSCLICPA